jgi:hypothetical protein
MAKKKKDNELLYLFLACLVLAFVVVGIIVGI